MPEEQRTTTFLKRTGLRHDDLARIEQLPFFSGLENEEIFDLLADATVRKHPRGAFLFSQEEPADRFFVVLDGWVKLSRETRDGHESVIDLFSKGESFAEAAMFESEVFPVDGVVIEESRLLAKAGGPPALPGRHS